MEDSERSVKRIRAKERRAGEGRGQSSADRPVSASDRLPPGQRRVDGLPVLDLGDQPVIPAADWRLSVGGCVASPVTWDWAALMAQPQRDVRVDIHCVTNWSSFDNWFQGVPVARFLDAARLRPEAAFVMTRGYDGYSTNLPLSLLREPDTLLCHSWNGAPLSREHGGPVRLLVPRLYFWKSAKWLRHLSVLAVDQPGFWEARGYHDLGDPWREQRYQR